jgi:hypothetical protein
VAYSNLCANTLRFDINIMEGNLLGKDMTTDKTTGGTENKTTNKKYKDTVFRMLFNNKKEALGLYNNLFDTEYTDESLIDIVTLEDVLFIPRKNDVAFTMNGRFVVTKKDTLEQYSRFIQIIEECRKSEENLDEAMKKAVNMAIENNILTEFLKENGSEVHNMLTLEYDEETARRVEREEAMEEGREEGRREGEQARRQLIISCLRKFKSCEVVADILDISVEEVQKIKDNM